MIGEARLAVPGKDAPDPEVQLCVFLLGRQAYAIDLMRVEEIFQPPELTLIPGAPPFAAGVMNLRGLVVPVVDLRKLLSSEGSGESKPKCLLCRIGNRRVAVLVDRVLEVLRVLRSQLKPLPALMAPVENPYVIGIAGPLDRLTLLLDLKSLLRSRARAGKET